MILVMTVLALIAMAIAYRKGVLSSGFSESGKLLVQVGPVLLPAFVLAGMVSVLIAPEKVGHWLGPDSGLKGLCMGTAAGALTPGGPFIAFPMLAVLLKGGASVGAVTAYLSAWALLGVHRVLAFEIPILGWRFTFVRFVSSLFAPVLIGFVAQWISARLS